MALIADFVEGFHRAIVGSGDDLAEVVDRFHTPDMVQVADGHVIDRDNLVAHSRAVRRTAPDLRVEVFDELERGGLVAARYRMHLVRQRRDGPEPFTVDVHEFVRFAEDGRLQRADVLTRMERPERPKRAASDKSAGE